MQLGGPTVKSLDFFPLGTASGAGLTAGNLLLYVQKSLIFGNPSLSLSPLRFILMIIIIILIIIVFSGKVKVIPYSLNKNKC